MSLNKGDNTVTKANACNCTISLLFFFFMAQLVGIGHSAGPALFSKWIPFLEFSMLAIIIMMMTMMMMINVNWGIIHMTQRKMFHAFINQIGRDVVACPLNSLVCNLGTERDLPTCAKIMLFLRASSLTCHSVLPYDYSVIMAPLNPRKKKKIRINPWLVEGKTSV